MAPAVPFLQTGEVGAVGRVVVLAVSTSTVDCSPFSTKGASVVAPLLTWGVLVVPGWL